MIKERIQLLREEMRKRGIDAYLIPTSDFHESEYVGDYFKCREYMTGFTGSAGTAIITMSEAGLWTDGRYFVQAARELSETEVILNRMGQEQVPTETEYLSRVLPQNGVLGFDGRVVNSCAGKELKEALSHKEIRFACEEDLVGEIWKERPALSARPVWILKDCYAGQTAGEKIGNLRSAMKKERASVHILTSLDDIAWLLNLRGDDILCNPVFLSYLICAENAVHLFLNQTALSEEVRSYLSGLGVSLHSYDEFYRFAAELKDETILLETSRTNYAVCASLNPSNRIVDRMNPTAGMKARKNPVEVENMRKAHIKDGTVMTRFIFWLKHKIGKIDMDEKSVSDYLDQLRLEQEGCLGLSFPTISAYGENAAMCHYSATEESKKTLKARGLYLVDSGGQYYEGTTDITRTIAMGELTDEEKEHFTLTVISMLRLAHVKFLYGTRGLTLDYVAREPFWKRGLNYDHGTGHGVGYLLNVHERPNGIRWKMVPERQDNGILEEGMVTSDEPGIYIEGSHGIRTENLVVCRKAEKNQYGQFMEFEFLTFVPIDLDAVDVRYMEDEDIRMLNEYHQQVYDKISPYLNTEEVAWLKEATRNIHR